MGQQPRSQLRSAMNGKNSQKHAATTKSNLNYTKATKVTKANSTVTQHSAQVSMLYFMLKYVKSAQQHYTPSLKPKKGTNMFLPLQVIVELVTKRIDAVPVCVSVKWVCGSI